MPTERDIRLMERALSLAKMGCYTTTPNPRVGCLLLKDGEIVAEGWHRQAGGLHAEMAAIEQLGESATFDEVFVTLEPCVHHGKTPPCIDALLAASPKRAVVAMEDPNPVVSGAGITRLREAGVQVDVGVLRAEAEIMNRGFVSRMTRGRPWTRVKAAATLDGKTALSSGLSRWITGEAARRDAHHLRACSCAVLTGIGTAEQDDPELSVRHVETERQPMKVLVDSRLRASPDLKMFASGRTLLASAHKDNGAYPGNVEVLSIPDTQGKVDLHGLVLKLAEMECNEIMVEAGAKLSGAMIEAGLADEIVLYCSPKIFGSGRELFSLSPVTSPDSAVCFRFVSVEMIGEDVKLTLLQSDAG